jgi:hypothetical protein
MSYKIVMQINYADVLDDPLWFFSCDTAEEDLDNHEAVLRAAVESLQAQLRARAVIP